jgi:hypothetical protein
MLLLITTVDDMRYNLVVASIREMMERNWDVPTMATRLKLDPALVGLIVDILR